MATEANNNEESEENQCKREAYEVFSKYHKHDELNNMKKAKLNFPMFHTVAKTGVIYATSRAKEYGFSHEDPDWANMGQGAPETAPLPGSPFRNYTLQIPDEEVEYAPTAGQTNLRAAIARYYNHLYRKGMKSQYSENNVCVVPGGRAGITGLWRH